MKEPSGYILRTIFRFNQTTVPLYLQQWDRMGVWWVEWENAPTAYSFPMALAVRQQIEENGLDCEVIPEDER